MASRVVGLGGKLALAGLLLVACDDGLLSGTCAPPEGSHGVVPLGFDFGLEFFLEGLASLGENPRGSGTLLRFESGEEFIVYLHTVTGVREVFARVEARSNGPGHDSRATLWLVESGPRGRFALTSWGGARPSWQVTSMKCPTRGLSLEK